MTFVRMLAVISLLNASVAPASPPITLSPPIEAGEIYIQLKNCGYVLNQSKQKPGTDLAKLRAEYSKYVWYGRCVDGLIDGKGSFANPGDPILGYPSAFILGRADDGGKTDMYDGEIYYSSEGKAASVSDGPNPFSPRWGHYDTSFSSPMREKFSVTAKSQPCMLDKKTADKSRCSNSNDYLVYLVSIWANGKVTKTFCPDPKTYVGCDKLWMTLGKPVFDDIASFIAPIEAGLAAQRTHYQSMITPQWRAQSEARYEAVLERGTAEELRDRIAALVVSEQLDEALRANDFLVRRFPNSAAVAQAKKHLTAAYCMQASPNPVLTVQDAAIAKRLFESEPCRGMAFAGLKLIRANGILESARQSAAYWAESDRQAAAYVAEQKRESAAHWGAVFGIIAEVAANQIAARAAPVYSNGGATASPSYGSQSATVAYPGAPDSGGSTIAPAGNQGNSSMFAVNRVTACAEYTLLPRVAGYNYFQMRNNCNYAIQVYVKVEEDGRWTTYADMRQEIAAFATLKSQGAGRTQMRTTLMAVCPAKSTLERQLGKRVTGVYTRNGSAFGCWSVLENTGVGRGN